VNATPFTTLDRAHAPRAAAPDGSDVRVLLGVGGGGLAEFELAAGAAGVGYGAARALARKSSSSGRACA